MVSREQLLNYYEQYMCIVGIAGHFIFILQMYEILQARSAQNVSTGGFSVAALSLLSWLIYGVLKQDKVLVLVNIFGLSACLCCLVSIVIFKG